jgi:hypothetical protein
MECTLATLIACFSWSGLFIDTGIQFQDRGNAAYYQFETWRLVDSEWVGEYFTQTADRPDNPYGKIGLGYAVDFGSVEIELEVHHTSSMSTGTDKGINSASLSMRWFPFQR